MRTPASPQRDRPQPLRVAEQIPLSAAGRQPVFFFGTLMDPEILARLLARPLAPGERARAWLSGFRRVCARNAPYPVLLPDPLGRVEGILLRRPGREDLRRINYYESDEYRAELHEVLEEGLGVREAWLFVAREEVLRPGEQPWRLEDWARRHKAELLRQIEEWMAELEPARAGATAARR